MRIQSLTLGFKGLMVTMHASPQLRSDQTKNGREHYAHDESRPLFFKDVFAHELF